MRRALLLMIAAMLLGNLLICAGYGSLVHTQIITPPSIYAQVGHLTLRSEIRPRPPCDPVRWCDASEPEIQQYPMFYIVWLIVDDSGPPRRRRMIRLLGFPLASR
jgi:hypothetical protein